MLGFALILHYFVLEYIPFSGVGKVSVVSHRMLKYKAIPPYKTLRAAKKAFFSTSKEVIVELRPMTDERHILRGLKDEGTTKKTTEKQLQRRLLRQFHFLERHLALTLHYWF